MEPSTLPPGVTHAGQTTPAQAAAPATTEPTQAAATATQVPVFDDGGKVETHSGNWDIYKICTGILLLSVGLMAIYYFRERTFIASADSKEKDKKINHITNEVSEIKQSLQAA